VLSRNSRHDHSNAAALPCRFCEQGHERPAHVFLECTASCLPELRVLLLVDAPEAWGRLLRLVDEAVPQEYSDSIPEMPAARLALEAAFTAADSTEARWLTYRRLLWAMPWPATAVSADAAAARAIGGIFDRTVITAVATRLGPWQTRGSPGRRSGHNTLELAGRSCFEHPPTPKKSKTKTESAHQSQVQVLNLTPSLQHVAWI